MVNFEATNTEGCQVPLMLVQCPSSLGDIDTTKADAAFEVRGPLLVDAEAERRPIRRGVEAVEGQLLPPAVQVDDRALDGSGGQRRLHSSGGAPGWLPQFEQEDSEGDLGTWCQSKYSEYSSDPEELATPAT